MHVSLDSALGRQRRLNSVGESVLQIAPNAAAAYSLRSLTGGDPAVVRVRRGGDNSEQDFTASQISAGALTSFVNEAGFQFNLEEAATDGSFADGPTNQIYASNADNTVWTGETTSSHTFQYTGSAWFYRYTDSATGNIYQVTANADSTHPYNANWFSSTVTTSTYNTGSYYGQSANLFADIGYFSFASPGDGFVETWYDQSGNDLDATQATASKQPKIVSAGALVTATNSLPAIDFTSSVTRLVRAEFLTGQLNSYFTTYQAEAGDSSQAQVVFRQGTSYRLLHQVETSGKIRTSINDAGSDFVRLNAGGDLATGSPLLQTTLIGARGSDGVTIFVNGTNELNGDSTDIEDVDFSAADSGDFFIGSNGTSTDFDFHGKGQEFIFYNSNQSANRVAIETNINSQYSIF
tara:strand:+ start:252 stop:1475 length:1224 start_codon:yes stop_codon:yes gene_type:complete